MRHTLKIVLLIGYCLLFGEGYIRFLQFLQSTNVVDINNVILQTRVRGNRIILPVNQMYIYENNQIDKLDKKIIHTKNSLGFRGSEPPKNLGDYLSIITVGASSTECFYLSDNKTWPYLLEQKLKQSYNNVWLNNAGLDGHSTFGHIILLEDYLVKLKPKIILFLIGSVDIGRDDLNKYDKNALRGVYMSWKDFLLRNSETLSVFANVLKSLDPRQKSLGHENLNNTNKIENLEISEEAQKAEILKHKSKYLEKYCERLLQLIDISKRNGIEPILITHPAFFGSGIDASTGLNLETVKVSDSMNGKLFWEILELYNDTVKEVGKSTNTFVIDLANKVPKSSLYFYDNFHFTNEGAEKVSGILYAELKNHLDNKYGPFIIK